MIDIIDWRITNKCNNHCLYCYACPGVKELSLPMKYKVLETLVNNGCEYLCITGGEPMLHYRDCVDLIKFANSQGIKIYLSTNGTNYLKAVNELNKLIVRLSLPLDGFDIKSNMCNGRIKDAFKDVESILSYYRNNSFKPFIKINTTVTALNNSTEWLIKMYEYLKNFHIDLWEIYEFIPEGNGLINSSELLISSSEFSEMENRFAHIINNPAFKIEFSYRKDRDSKYFIIQPNGDVIVPIDKMNSIEEMVIGNILQHGYANLEKKWRLIANNDVAFLGKRINQRKNGV